LEVLFFSSDNGEAWYKGCIEAGGTDYGVDFVALAFGVYASICVKGGYASFYHSDVFFFEGLKMLLVGDFTQRRDDELAYFKITGVGRQSTTAYSPVWNQSIFEMCVLERLPHLAFDFWSADALKYGVCNVKC
jgi:hypothetical protein